MAMSEVTNQSNGVGFMEDHTKALNVLADAAKRTVSQSMPQSPSDYDFAHLGATLADSISALAEELTAEAQKTTETVMLESNKLADQARLLAADIRAQTAEHARLMADINTRLKASGETMLAAHRKFNGG